MKGADYVALVVLHDKFGKVIAAPGETCDRVPDESLGWLEEGGYIKRPDKTAAAPRRKPTKEGE